MLDLLQAAIRCAIFVVPARNPWYRPRVGGKMTVEHPLWSGEERRGRRAHPTRCDVYVVDNDAARASSHAALLADAGYEARVLWPAQRAIDGADAALVVVAMLHLPDMNGCELAKRLHALRPDLPVIVLATDSIVEDVIAAMHEGVFDFIALPEAPGLFTARVRRAVEHAKLAQDLEQLRATSVRARDGFTGSSPAITELTEAVARLANTDVTVHIRGETGSGKELVARAIHESSARRAGPFVAVNCAALPATLLESDLFGHVRGAYTDAKSSREGLFVQASGGTLFLDEIGDMPLEMQPKLLRALQERRVRPLGGSSEVSFDTRVLSATHQDIEALVKAGSFREDLYYRINVVTIDLPPLRARGNDIIEIASDALARAALRDQRPPLRIPAAVAERLLHYDWPGNVRELENCMERLIALAATDSVAVSDLPHRIRDQPMDVALNVQDIRDIVSIAVLEERYIHQVIKLLGGNRSSAADILGIDRRTLYRRLAKYEAEQGQEPISASAREPQA